MHYTAYLHIFLLFFMRRIGRALGLLKSTHPNALLYRRQTSSFLSKYSLEKGDLPAHMVESIVRSWVMEWVQRLGLCPWSGQVLVNNRMRIVVCPEDPTLPTDLQRLEQRLVEESKFIMNKNNKQIAKVEEEGKEQPQTTLLVLPSLRDFPTFLEVHSVLEDILEEYDLDPDIQIATFHPHYQFAEAKEGDVENYTNRSPFPIFHLLQVEQVSEAIDKANGDTSFVWKRNIALLRSMGLQEVKRVQEKIVRETLQSYRHPPSP